MSTVQDLPDRQGVLAVIFAAGMGLRLQPRTGALPKCLLEVGGQTLLARQLEACASAGLADIVIITGFRAEELAAAAGERVSFAQNPLFATSQTLYSFLQTRSLGAGRPQVHIDGDNCFEPDLLRRLVVSPFNDVLLVDTAAELDDEATKALVRDRLIVSSAKELPAANAEATGLRKLSARFVDDLYAFAADRAAAGELHLHMFDAISPLLAQHELHAIDTDGAPWIEIDDPADLVRAREMFAGAT